MKQENAKGFNFEGKQMTKYEGTQLMRRCERRYRQLDRETITAIDEKTKQQIKTKKKQLKQKYMQLCEAGGFKPQYDRFRN